MPEILLVFGAMVVMEPVAYLAHRFVMHGVGAGWHRGHHQVRTTRFEANDLYPVVMAGLTIGGMTAAVTLPALAPLFWVGVGVTLYGAAYLFVHDLYIHRRIRRFRATIGVLEPVREAHRIHHLWSGEPYGFLLPIVPRALKERARHVDRDPLLAPAPAAAEVDAEEHVA